ncbi:MAG: hypothetical protein IKX45_01440 [Bacteroidales bacterium]|nr:hypothetical protein [Bacteroidales bacterium]
MNKKQLITTRGTYIAPECDSLELKVQGIICQSKLGAPGAAGLGFSSGDNINDYTGFDF